MSLDQAIDTVELMSKDQSKPIVIDDPNLHVLSPEIILESEVFQPLVNQIRELLMQAVQQTDSVHQSSRKQLQKLVIAIAQSVRLAVEFVEVVDGIKKVDIQGEETSESKENASRDAQKSSQTMLQKYKKYMNAKLIALNIVRIICVSLEIAIPMFSIAWIVFRLTGYKMADSLDTYARDLDKPVKNSCCTLV